MQRPILLLAAALLLGVGAACGGKAAQSADATASVVASRYTVATPELPGTPLVVCPRFIQEGIVASSYAIENGFAFEVASLDETTAQMLQETAATRIESQRVIEAQLQRVRAEQQDEGQGVFIRFFHDDTDILDILADILQRGIDKRPAAARRVDIRRGDGFVDMQLPPGGPLITSKTNEAARETVQKWTDREPTGLSYEATGNGIKVEVRSSDRERINDLRSDVLEDFLRCSF